MELERLKKMWDEKLKLFKDKITLLKNSKQYPVPKVADPALEKELAQSNHVNTTLQRSSNASNSITILLSPLH